MIFLNFLVSTPNKYSRPIFQKLVLFHNAHLDLGLARRNEVDVFSSAKLRLQVQETMLKYEYLHRFPA